MSRPGEDWEEDTLPDTVREPTVRPPAPAPSGTFDRVEDLPSLLIDGVLWAPETLKIPARTA